MNHTEHRLTLPACEVWSHVDHDGATVLDLCLDTPENGITLSIEDVMALAAVAAQLQTPDLLAEATSPPETEA